MVRTAKRIVVTVMVMTSVITSLADVQTAARVAGQAACVKSRMLSLVLVILLSSVSRL